MGYFSNLTARLGIDITPFNRGLRAASSSANKFSNQLAKSFTVTSTSANKATKSVSVFGNAVDKGYKSVRRIAQGILVSQAFYRTVNAVQEATKEVYEFSQAIEEARVAYTGLIGDANKANRFNNMLQDFAADTPYTYQQAADNARLLLSYEFKLVNMERVMRSIADATAASGKVESYKNISEALGQIQAKGKLSSRELIRLANAGIPAFQILREELGMTYEQISNLGKAPVMAEVAIPAILRGMDRRYGGASKAMQRTTKGLGNNIKENLLIITQNAFDPMYQNFRVNMEKISERLNKMREDVREGGLGLMLMNMFPPEIYQKIQLLGANLQMIIQNLKAFFMALAPVRSAFTELFVNALNAVLPFINAMVRILVVLMQMLTSNSKAVRIFVAVMGGMFIISTVIKLILGLTAVLKSLLIVKIVAQGIVMLTKAIALLSATLVSNPLIAFAALAVGGIMAMTLANKKFGASVDSLVGKVSKLFGVDPSNVFKPKMAENTQIAGEFNKELKISSKGLKEMGDKAKEAGKKAKEALMSFDEVFTIPEAKDDGMDDMFNLPDIEMPEIPPFDASEMFPDVGAQVTEWTQGIADDIKSKLQKALLGAGIGAIIGGIIGAIFGSMPGALLGAKIGAAAGAIAGLFWEKLVEFFKTPTGIGIGIGALLGGIVGGIIGGPMGAAIGAALGGTLGGVVGHFWEDIKAAFETSQGTGALTGALIGAGIGMIVGGPLGAALGAALGGTIGYVVGKFWEDIKEAFLTDTGIGAVTGTLIGAGIGMIIAGPLGAALGAALGGGLGAVVGKYWEDIKAAFQSEEGKAATVGASIGALIGLFLGGPLGAALGAALGGVVGGLFPAFWDGVTKWYDDTVAKLDAWWEKTYNGFITWKDNTVATVSGWVSDTYTDIKTWTTDTYNDFVTWKDDTIRTISDWYTETTTDISNWWSDVNKGFSDWKEETYGKIVEWSETSGKEFVDWVKGSKSGFDEWRTETGEVFKDGLNTKVVDLIGWIGDTSTRFAGWVGSTLLQIIGWDEETSKRFKEWRTGVYGTISEWYNDTTIKFGNWKTNVMSSFSTWWSDTRTGFTDWAKGIYDDVVGWFDNMWKKLRDFFDDLKFWKKEAKDEESNVRSSIAPTRSSSSGGGGAGGFRMYSMDPVTIGHAKGGTFKKEHVARFNEGNRMETILPVENPSAMAKVRQAIFGGEPLDMLRDLIESTSQGTEQMQPLYVGTLIADERSLRELERRMYDIRQVNNFRRGK